MKKKVIKHLIKPANSITETKHTTQKSLHSLKNIYISLAEKSNLNPSATEVQLLVEKYRMHISKYYYECDISMLKELGNLYTTDDRFKMNLNSYKPGFADFLKNAIDLYCVTEDKKNNG